MRSLSLLVGMFIALSACGPAFAPIDAPARPCDTITEAEFNAALEKGATRADAEIGANGIVTMTTGIGAVHCATFGSSTVKPCRRPNDFVIRYQTAENGTVFVRVPANEEYRFKVANRPHTCEVIVG